MSDLLLTAMLPPGGDTETVFETRDGTPYRADAATGIIQARPEHVADLQAQGFVLATAAHAPPGVDLQMDVGWSEDPQVAAEEQ